MNQLARLRGVMTLIVLVIGLLACAFYIYVLYQWMRDANGKRTRHRLIAERGEGTKENKRPYIIGPRKIADRGYDRDMATQGASILTGFSGRRGLGWNERERIAYQRIVSSLSLREKR